MNIYDQEYMKKLPFKFDIEELKKGLKDIEKYASFDNPTGQIGLTHTANEYEGKDKRYEACGSFSSKSFPTENDFTEFNEDLKDTYFYEVYKTLSTMYNLGRVRLLQIQPKRCLSWHIDQQERIHVPIISNSGNILAILNKCYFLPADGSSYIVNLILTHSAFNGGFEPRYNFLCSITGYKKNAVTNLEKEFADEELLASARKLYEWSYTNCNFPLKDQILEKRELK